MGVYNYIKRNYDEITNLQKRKKSSKLNFRLTRRNSHDWSKLGQDCKIYHFRGYFSNKG